MRITVLALCLLLSTTARAPAQARPRDEAGIRSRVAAYEAAVNARDFPAIARVFTPDADLVVFDPATVRETNSFEKPKSYPVGIPYTIVNGVVVIDGGKHTGARPGRALMGRAFVAKN